MRMWSLCRRTRARSKDEDDAPDTDPATYTLKHATDEEFDMSDCVQKILEGLRGDAFCIARDIGLDRLLRYDGIDHLVEEIRKQAFPLQSEEASELFRQGQLLTGPLARRADVAVYRTPETVVVHAPRAGPKR